jgi:hypothetical protein
MYFVDEAQNVGTGFAPNHSNTHSSIIRDNQTRVKHFIPNTASNKLKTSLSQNICVWAQEIPFSPTCVLFS